MSDATYEAAEADFLDGYNSINQPVVDPLDARMALDAIMQHNTRSLFFRADAAQPYRNGMAQAYREIIEKSERAAEVPGDAPSAQEAAGAGFIAEMRRTFQVITSEERIALLNLRFSTSAASRHAQLAKVGDTDSGCSGFERITRHERALEIARQKASTADCMLSNLSDALGLCDVYYEMRMEFYPEV